MSLRADDRTVPPGQREDATAEAAVLALVRTCTDALLEARLVEGPRTGWLAWYRDPVEEDRPATLRIGGPGVYDGDAGIGWALAHLAPVLPDRPSLPEAARRALQERAVLTDRFGGGLLDGLAGVAVARSAVMADTRHTRRVGIRLVPAPLPGPEAVAPHVDHLSGLSGLLLAHLTLGSPRRDTDEVASALLAAGRAEREGWCYPGGRGDDAQELAPLCGLAHGSSGILLALAHWLADEPPEHLARRGRRRLAQAWAWESAWADPVLGWPDLRERPAAYPTLWCHGAAGVAVTRLELLRLAQQGVDLGIGTTVLSAQAEDAVRLCGQQVRGAADQARRQVATLGVDSALVDPLDAGLTLCHGLGGPLDVLASAARHWGVAEHLDTARDAALAIARLQGDRPSLWPTGHRTRGGYGLFQGLAGTALVLARLVDPASTPSPSLFGVPAR